MFQYRSASFAAGTQDASLALGEVLASFSYALDLTEGQPAGHSVRATWIAMHLGQFIGMTDDDLHLLFYAVLLKDLGCSSNAARVAALFAGNDRNLKHDFKLIGPNPEHFGAFVMTKAGQDVGEGERPAVVENILANAGAIMTDLIDTRCTRGADIARQLRFSEDVADAVANLDEHWDGSGLPLGVAGDAIPLCARIALLAQVVDVFFMAAGGLAARKEVARRRGSWLDPQLADAFLALSGSPEFWRALSASTIRAQLFDLEPAQFRVEVDEDYLDDIATAFGQVIDAKSPFTGGHSNRVGHLAGAIGARLGLDAAQCRTLCRSAMLHDVGKLGVSSRILEKPGKLDNEEWTAMQVHAALTTDILSRVGVMRDMAMIAGAHHERLDGRGYPLGLDARMIALETRIISVADFFDALTADRPYRAAMSLDAAMDVMQKETGTAIDPACFAALCHVVERGEGGLPLPAMDRAFF